MQVDAAVRTYGKFTGLRSAAVFVGVGMGPPLQAFQRGVDIVSATPGRLLDHIGRGNGSSRSGGRSKPRNSGRPKSPVGGSASSGFAKDS